MSPCYHPALSFSQLRSQDSSKLRSRRKTTYACSHLAKSKDGPGIPTLTSALREISSRATSTSQDSSEGLRELTPITLEDRRDMSNEPKKRKGAQRIHDPISRQQCMRTEGQSQPVPQHIKQERQSGHSHTNQTISTSDEDETSLSDLDDIAEDETSPQTATDRRAEKRKMTRFRLTHNQTRYLTAEFARQPHPDTVQRERLSQEIPGLSSRQVQVWFQNRRAKLKRLTASDREQMMKSRALPEDFDRSTALRPNSLMHQANFNSTLSPFNSTDYSRISTELPRTGHRRDPSVDTSTGSVPSLFSEPMWSPSSLSGSQTNSPISRSDERTYYSSSFDSHVRGPLQETSYARSPSFPSLPGTPTSLPHRSRAESLASLPFMSSTQPSHARRRSAEIQIPSARMLGDSTFSAESRFEQRVQGVNVFSPNMQNSYTFQSQTHLTSELQSPLSAYTSVCHAGPTYSTQAGTLAPVPFPPGFPVAPSRQPTRQDQKIPSLSPTAYRSLASDHQDARSSLSVSYPTQHPNQIPYSNFATGMDPTYETQEGTEYTSPL